MAKKQFKKEIELTDEQLFEDVESSLEKEQIDRVISKNIQQVFTEPKYDKRKEKFKNHRDWLLYKYDLKKDLAIAVDTKQLKVLNIDYTNIIKNRTETIPNYLDKLFCGNYSDILHYDAVMQGSNVIFKKFLLKL